MHYSDHTGSLHLEAAGGWDENALTYRRVISDTRGDSVYLRERGLQPNVLALTDYRPSDRVLDVGCGDSWLLNTVRPEHGAECDVTGAGHVATPWPFSMCDVTSLSYPDAAFDLVVASLVLMFSDDLSRSCEELFRVASKDSRLVIAITHPVFYRMGMVEENGDVTIQRDYGAEFVIPNLFIANRVGPFRYYHRPLSAYFTSLIQAGWTITEFREWSIDIDDYRLHFPTPPADAPRRTGRLPLYAFFQCKKRSR